MRRTNYSTLFHDLVYSTGPESRLHRTFGDRFGDELHSKEELVAEMGAAFLCALTGIANKHTDRNTTSYIRNRIEKLEEDNRLIVHAAANAQRAVMASSAARLKKRRRQPERKPGRLRWLPETGLAIEHLRYFAFRFTGPLC
jgi:antirestriction protein ArdC